MPGRRDGPKGPSQTTSITSGTLIGSGDPDFVSCYSRMTSSNDVEGVRRLWERSARAQRSQNPVEHRVEFLREVLGEITQDEIAVLLKELVLAPIAAVRDRICEVLGTIDLDNDPRIGAQQIDFHSAEAIERDR